MPRKPSASRARTRRLGLLGLLLTTLLTPAGIMVGTVTAAALIGGAFHLYRAAPAAPSTPAQSFAGQAGSPQHLSIEREGETVSLVLSEDRLAVGSGADMLDPGSPLFAGLPGSGLAPHAAPGGMPPHASPGAPTPGGGKPSFAGPAPVSPFLTGPNGAPPGVGPSHPGSPRPAGAPPGSPSIPSVAGDPHTPTGNGDTHEPPGETDDPTRREKNPPTVTHEETLPGMPIPPLAGNPLDSQMPPPGKQRVTQPNAVPEPSMLGLMLLGSAAMAWAGRRRPARAA